MTFTMRMTKQPRSKLVKPGAAEEIKDKVMSSTPGANMVTGAVFVI